MLEWSPSVTADADFVSAVAVDLPRLPTHPNLPTPRSRPPCPRPGPAPRRGRSRHLSLKGLRPDRVGAGLRPGSRLVRGVSFSSHLEGGVGSLVPPPDSSANGTTVLSFCVVDRRTSEDPRREELCRDLLRGPIRSLLAMVSLGRTNPKQITSRGVESRGGGRVE